MSSADSSNASTLSSLGDDSNPILPTSEQVEHVLARSKLVWQRLLETAKFLKSIPQESLSLSNRLDRFPALPDDLKGTSFLQGVSTWSRSSPGTCTLATKTGKEQRWNPILPGGRPMKCVFSLQLPFANGMVGSDRITQPFGHQNGVFIILAGWVYILAKKLLEKQDLPVIYSTKLAPATNSHQQIDTGENRITVDIGDASSDELLWWRALLAPGQGWQVPSGQQPPWAITYEGDVIFTVFTTSRSIEQFPRKPPASSSQAVQFLSRFSARYNLGTQSSVALAMALTLPLLNLFTPNVQVPKPRLGRPCIPSSVTSTNPCQLLEDFDNISKYMTMSSNPRFLSSALWSTFWEPGVDCNLVSPWCDGIIEILEPLIETDLELLAHTLALRRPFLAPFWYGVLSFGRSKLTERLILFLKTQQAPTPMGPIPEVALWTRSRQSYMDLCGSGAYVREDNTISRADAWRLRHDCWKIEAEGIPFRNPPLLGWPPFGFMRPDDLELEVHRHSHCERHRWQYDHWTWHFENGHSIDDESCKGQQHEDWISEFGSHPNFHHHDNSSYMPNNVATEAAV